MPGTRPEVVGILLTDSVSLLPESSIPDLTGKRERLGLVSNEVSGEGFRAITPLGYFRSADHLFGVFLSRGYEGESYRVYDMDAEGLAPVAQLHGGGC